MKTGLQIMEDIEQNLIITACDYAIATGMCLNEYVFEQLCEIEKYHNEFELIQKILAVQLSIYVLRRIPGSYGESITRLRDILKDLKAEYQETFLNAFEDINYNANW